MRRNTWNADFHGQVCLAGGLRAASRPRARYLLVAAAVLALVGYQFIRSGSSGSPALQQPGGPVPFGIAEVYRTNPAPHSYGAIELCLSKSGAATITSLVPQGGSGLTVLDYATRPGSSSFGASQRTLAQEGFPSSHVVAASCAAGQFTEVGLTVQRTGPGNGRFEALRINYDSAGKHRSLVLPFSLKVCGPDGRTTASCGDAKSP